MQPSRRPSKSSGKRAIDYLTCANCYGTYSSTVLRYHFNKCTNNAAKNERCAKELGRAVEGRIHTQTCDDLQLTIFPSMVQDDAAKAAQFDWLVVTYGNDLCLNYGEHYLQGMVRDKLKSAGKILVAARSISSEITDFSSIYNVKHCETVIGAIRKVAKFDPKTKTVKSPHTASSMVILVNTLGELLIVESMKQDDDVREKNVQRFLTVFKKKAKTKLNKIVSVAKIKIRREKKLDIPKVADVRKLAVFVDSRRDKLFAELQQKFSHKTWLHLTEHTLMSVLVLNRKRVGDVQNIQISDFNRQEIITEDDDELESIPENIKKFIKSRILIRGKLYKTVPVLLTHDNEKCLQLLLQHRKEAGVPDENEFLFGEPSKVKKVKTFNACILFRKFSIACGAEKPTSLRGTKLRKQLGRACAKKNLTDNEVTNVATFMGHHDTVHRKVYRHNSMQKDVVQMCGVNYC